MKRIPIGCIVEGFGDVSAVPTAIGRIAREVDSSLLLRIYEGVRVPRSKLVKEGELENTVELTARKIGGQGAIIIVIDADDDCPAQLGPALLQRATKARSDIPIAVILAKKEFEAWFLAAIESLRGIEGVPMNAKLPPDPEGIRGAKERMRQIMGRYSETLHQDALAKKFDLQAARRCDSFDKLYRDVERILKAV